MELKGNKMKLYKIIIVVTCAVAMACAAADGQKRTECHGYYDEVIRINFPATLAGFSMTTRTTYADGDDDYSLSYFAGNDAARRDLTIYVFNKEGLPLTDGVNDDVVQQLSAADKMVNEYHSDVDSSGMTTEGQFAKCGLKYLWTSYLLKQDDGGKTSSSFLLLFSLRNRFIKLRYSEPAAGKMKSPSEMLPSRLSKVLSALDALVHASEIDVYGIGNPTNRLETIRKKWPRAADRISQWDMPDYYKKFHEINRFQKWCGKDKANRYGQFAVACRDAIAMKIEPAIWYYNLACVFSVTGKPKEAFDALEQAIAAGYDRSEWARADEDFNSLTNDMRFAKLCETMDLIEDPWNEPELLEVDTGTLALAEDNVYYALDDGSYLCNIVTTAACPVVYLNHHKDHDVVPCDGLIVPQFPKEAVERRRNAGAANMHFVDVHASTEREERILVPAIVASNWTYEEDRIDKSMSIPADFGLDGNKANAELMHAVCFNSIGIYTAASDYGFDGIDRFIGHSPFCIAHAGGADESDKFVRLCRDIIKALPSADRKNASLLTLGIIRRAQKGVKTETDYMSGFAWRPVMRFADIDVERAISLAKAKDVSTNMPPLILDATFDEKFQTPCTDLWDAPYDHPRQSDGKLNFCFIARSAEAVQRYEVEVKDLCEAPGEFVWKVLQGDEKKVQLVPLKDDKSNMRIEVGWHNVFDVKLPNGKKVKSSRVDIGCFSVRSGVASLPAIVSIYFSPNETREYGANGKLVSIDYSKRQLEGFCPKFCPRGDWKDVFHWNKDGKLTGWTRFCTEMNGQVTTNEFTREGLMIDTRDALGRPKDVHHSLLSTWKQGFDLPDFTNEVGQSKLGYQGSQYDLEEGNPLKTTLAWKYEYKDAADRFGKPSPKDPAPFRYRPELCLRADFADDSGFRLPIADQMRLGFYTHVGYRHDTIGWSDRADELMREDSRVALEMKGLKQPEKLKKMKFCPWQSVTNGAWRVEIDEAEFGLNGRLFELSDGVYRIHVPQKDSDDDVTFASTRDTYWAANRLLEGEAYARLDETYRRCPVDEVRKVGFRKMPWEDLSWDEVEIVTGEQLDQDDLSEGKSATLAVWQIVGNIYFGIQANGGAFVDRTCYFVKFDKSTGKAMHLASFRQLPSMAFGNAVIGADAGDAVAMNNLAVLLYAGIADYERYDESAVIKLLKRSSQLGNETAKRNLAILFENRGADARME